MELIDKHFPVKISYCCTHNMKSVIQKHNSKVLKSHTNDMNIFNSRDKLNCPLNGNCLQKCIAYRSTVKSDRGEVRDI